MSDGDINSTLFRGVIANINNLSSADGNRIHEGSNVDGFDFNLAYQERPAERFAHNYERDKFLHNRDKYVVVAIHGHYYILLRCREREYVEFYTKPLSLMFPDRVDGAVHVFERLLHKFYDHVTSEVISDVRIVDFSNGMGSNNARVTYEVQ